MLWTAVRVIHGVGIAIVVVAYRHVTECGRNIYRTIIWTSNEKAVLKETVSASI
jgi:hypothetical protein